MKENHLAVGTFSRSQVLIEDVNKRLSFGMHANGGGSKDNKYAQSFGAMDSHYLVHGY